MGTKIKRDHKTQINGSTLNGLNDLGTIIKSKFEGSIVVTDGAVGIGGSMITVSLLLSIGIFLNYKV